MKKFEIVDHGYCFDVVLTKAFWKHGVKSGGGIGDKRYKTREEAEQFMAKLVAGVGEKEEKRLGIWRVPLLCQYCEGTGFKPHSDWVFCSHCDGTALTPHSDHKFHSDMDAPPLRKSKYRD